MYISPSRKFDFDTILPNVERLYNIYIIIFIVESSNSKNKNYIYGDNRSYKIYLYILANHFLRYSFISTSKVLENTYIKLIDSVVKYQPVKIILVYQYMSINSKELQIMCKQ